VDGATDTPAPAPANPAALPDDSFKLKFCTVCASNQNRYAIPSHDITSQHNID